MTKMDKQDVLIQLRALEDEAIERNNIEQLAALQCAITMVIIHFDVPNMATTLGAGDR